MPDFVEMFGLDKLSPLGRRLKGLYVLDSQGNAVPEPDTLRWGQAFQEMQRHLAVTEIGEARVSTVFLALDHSFGDGPPLLWETMVFGGALDGEQMRYASKEEAERGHNETVGRVTRAALRKKRLR